MAGWGKRRYPEIQATQGTRKAPFFFGRRQGVPARVRSGYRYGQGPKGLIGVLLRRVHAQPIGIKATGRLGKKAADFFSNIAKAATQQADTATISPSEWPWSAQSLPSFWMMRISFTVAKITTLTVHHGARRALAAHAEL